MTGQGDDARWRRVNELFHLALERPDSERAAFLDEACGSDSRLRDDIRSLLEAHSQADAFLDVPAVPPAAGSEAEVPAPVIIGQYRIDRVLGRGGMGVVYLAEDTTLGRLVALKMVAPDYSHDLQRRERLRREARVAALLAHPGIATVYALEEFGNDIFIAAEYVPGETLREEIARGPATHARVLDTAIALASALAAAHDRGVIHRDLKPENVIRMPDGGIKILDFGLAQMPPESPGAKRLTVHGRVIGTPAYMSPEQLRLDPIDGRADLFALGIVLSELITGTHPFDAGDSARTITRILESDPNFVVPPATDANRRMAEELGAIIRKCLAKAPAARFSSAHALLAALEQVRQGGGGRDAIRPADAASAMRWWQFHQAATCLCYVGLLLPLWWARGFIGRPGLFVFVAGLISTVAAVVLRLHLWFAASSLPEEWRAQREQSHPWLRVAEVVLVATLAVAGCWVVEEHAAVGATLISASVAVLLSSIFIEPATTRVAFKSF